MKPTAANDVNEVFFYKSPLGTLRITSDKEFITEVSFAKAQQNDSLRTQLKHASPAIKNCVKQLDEYFAGTRNNFEIDLAQAGTQFQQFVWNGLRNIKYGATQSYLQLSKSLGNAKAIRAVGTANGKNNIAIIVPCHRVIGSNGALVGYAGELWRKKWLLAHEAKHAHGVQALF